MRLAYGVDRLPRDIASRSVAVGAEPLRLNSEPVPAEAMPLAIGDHAARVAAAVAWLESQCGDYAPLRRQFITAYLRLLAAEIAAHRDELLERVKPYDGLFAPEDFLWSALRPLPRGWVSAGGTWLPADIVFWDGAQVIAVELSAREAQRQKALSAAGILVCRIDPAKPEMLPAGFRRFWDCVVLPASPFRRPVPDYASSGRPT